MRILMLTASLPYPPQGGGALRTIGILHGLHAARHEITLLSFHEGTADTADTPLASYCSRIETIKPPQRTLSQRLRDLVLTRQPDIARRFYSDTYAAKLKKVLSETKYDLVQAEGIEMTCYLPLARTMQPTARLCYDSFNAEYTLQAAMGKTESTNLRRLPAVIYSRIQATRIERYEREICRTADLVIAVSQEDSADLQKLIPGKTVPVVPNGIFTERYIDQPEMLDLGENALVFTGTMDYRPNVDAMMWFGEHIFPLVQKQINANLYIVGQKPHARLEALRAKPGIHIIGRVLAVQPYLHSAAIYVAPLRMGGGTRLKVIEAMASGCAIVSTTIGASGLQAEAKRAMIVVDDADTMANAIVALLHDSERRKVLGAAARQYVQANYDWSVLIPRLLAIYREQGLG